MSNKINYKKRLNKNTSMSVTVLYEDDGYTVYVAHAYKVRLIADTYLFHMTVKVKKKDHVADELEYVESQVINRLTKIDDDKALLKDKGWKDYEQ